VRLMRYTIICGYASVLLIGIWIKTSWLAYKLNSLKYPQVVNNI